jgi:transmembrane sensor
MDHRESATTIADVANGWIVRIDRGLSADEQVALDNWVSADARHLGAFTRAQALWLHADRAKIYRASNSDSPDPAVARSRRPLRRWVWAASLIVTLSVAGYGWHEYQGTHFSTAVGEIRHIPLADGSSVTLNTQSAIKIDYSNNLRSIRLDRGEALFDVAHNDGRPFMVEAGALRVRAIGTEFVVRRDDHSNSLVTVARGVVEVWQTSLTPEPSIRLAAGLRAAASQSAVAHPERVSDTDIARSIAWQDGVLDLNGRTLGEAAAEFNRYNRNAVVINDRVLSQRAVVGRFNTSDPKGFAVAAAAMLGAHVRVEANQIILER